MNLPPDKVPKSYFSAEIRDDDVPVSFSYFEGHDHSMITRSSLYHEWSRVYFSYPNIIFRITQFNRSFYLLRELVSFSYIMK